MNIILLIIFILLLLIVAYQDIKQRLVSLLAFGGLATVAIAIRWNSPDYMMQVFASCSLIAMQILMLFLMFRIKNKKWENIINRYLGLGDILFLGVLAFFLPPLMTIFFEVVSCILIIIFYILLSIIKNRKLNSFSNIPLAGLLSIFLAGFIVANQFLFKINIQNDDYLIMKYIYGI